MYNNVKYYKISGGCTLWIQNYPIHRLYHRFLVVLEKSVNALERKIKSLTGEYLVKGVLAEKVQVEKYAPNEYINPDFVKNCNILPNYDRISGSDYVSGTYRGVPFTFCDLHLQYKDTYRDKNGRKRTRYHAKKMVFSPVSSAVRQNFSA